jgi:hypothetical protein
MWATNGLISWRVMLWMENGIELHAPVRPSDFLPLSRVRLLEGWQSGWDGNDMGKYAYSIWPVVSFMPWVRRFDGDRDKHGTDRYRGESHVRLFTGL